jgi:hypothetical protein
VVVVRPIEEAVIAVGKAVSTTSFGETLRNDRAITNHDSVQAPAVSPTIGRKEFELSLCPAIQRSFAAIGLMRLNHQKISDADQQWELWCQSALKAVQRIAGKCWAHVREDLRHIFVDYDDLLPIERHAYITSLRFGTVGPHLNFCGLNQAETSEVLRTMWGAVRASELGEEVLEASDRAGHSAKVMRELANSRLQFTRSLQERGQMRLGDAWERHRELVRGAYWDVSIACQEVTAVLRRFNGFVHRILWTILGIADAGVLPVIEESVSPHQLSTSADGQRRLHLTADLPELFWLRPTHPILVSLSTPTDGLYVVEKYTISFSGGMQSDLRLESVWPCPSDS